MGNKQAWKGFWAAWIGWAFDGLDGFIYPLVAGVFVAELMGLSKDNPDVKLHAGLIQAVFLFGWAIGGTVFGRVADKIGRAKTLSLTILIYAVFTGLSAFTGTWWQLMIVRFIAALGIGGEWAAGSALVSETLPKKFRPWASATLQSGYMVGMAIAVFTVMAAAASHLDSMRWVFLIGVLPAFATLWIRKAIPEPEAWQKAQEQQTLPKVRDLFRGEVRKITLLTVTLASICLTTVWAFLFFLGPLLSGVPEVAKLGKAEQVQTVMGAVLTLLVWNVVGNYVASYLSKLIGYRRTFTLFLLCSFLVFFFGFQHPLGLAQTRLVFHLAAFFSLGLFALFPMYIPPLFPVLLRTTGAGFCYNFGRLISAAGTLAAAGITARFGPTQALWLIGFLFIPGTLVAWFMPELSLREED